MISDSIKAIATQVGINPKLAVAVAMTETSLNPLLCRFEPQWKWFLKPEKFADQLGITEKTEEIQQQTSWGVMQVMGSVARELGHTGPLTELVKLEVGAKYGCIKLKNLLVRWPLEQDAIAAYNAGNVRKDGNGKYFNQTYVDRVREKMKALD